MDHIKEMVTCQGRAGQVVPFDSLIMVGLWKCQLWTKQDGVENFLREEYSSWRKGSELGLYWGCLGDNQEAGEVRGHSRRCGQECYHRSLCVNGRMCLSLGLKWAALGDLPAEVWIIWHSTNGDRPVPGIDILHTCEDLSTGAICEMKRPIDSNPKRVAES